MAGGAGTLAGFRSGGPAALLLVPLLAMQVTDEMNWGPADFAIFGAMLAGVGGTYEFAARMATSNAYQAAVGIALATTFVLVWMNLAVGIVGAEDNPANLLHGGVLAVAIIGAVIARLQPHGMAGTLVATALAQALAAMIVLIAGLGFTVSLTVLTSVFVALWLRSAWLFRKAAREGIPADAAP